MAVSADPLHTSTRIFWSPRFAVGNLSGTAPLQEMPRWHLVSSALFQHRM